MNTSIFHLFSTARYPSDIKVDYIVNRLIKDYKFIGFISNNQDLVFKLSDFEYITLFYREQTKYSSSASIGIYHKETMFVTPKQMKQLKSGEEIKYTYNSKYKSVVLWENKMPNRYTSFKLFNMIHHSPNKNNQVNPETFEINNYQTIDKFINERFI